MWGKGKGAPPPSRCHPALTSTCWAGGEHVASLGRFRTLGISPGGQQRGRTPREAATLASHGRSNNSLLAREQQARAAAWRTTGSLDTRCQARAGFCASG